MQKDKMELLENYQKLDPENKEAVSAYVRVALAAQENALKSMKRDNKKGRWKTTA